MVALIEPQARCMCRGGVIVCVLAVQVDHLRTVHMLIVVLCWCRREVGVGLFLEVQTQPKSQRGQNLSEHLWVKTVGTESRDYVGLRERSKRNGYHLLFCKQQMT